MKIIHLCEVLGIGGLPNYVIQFARAYMDTHPEDEVIIAYMNDKPGENLELSGLNVVGIKTFEDLKALKPDFMHVHLLSQNDFIEKLFTLNVPLVRSYHEYTSTCLRRGRRRWPGDRCQRALNIGCAAFGCIISPPRGGSCLPHISNLPAKIHERDLYREFDGSITGSIYMRNMLIKNGYPEDRAYTIPYFSRFCDDAYTPKPDIPFSGTLEILFTGQAVAGKGLEILIEALGGLKGAWHLTVHSEGARLEAAKEKARNLGIDDKISFKGWVHQSALREAYKAAHVMVIPSIWDDPGPLVGVEALAVGTPVVGFAVGGISDYTLNGKTGYLVTDISIEGLRAGLQECLDHPERIYQMGLNGQKLVAEEHTTESHIKRAYEIYCDAIERRKNINENTRRERHG